MIGEINERVERHHRLWGWMGPGCNHAGVHSGSIVIVYYIDRVDRLGLFRLLDYLYIART